MLFSNLAKVKLRELRIDRFPHDIGCRLATSRLQGNRPHRFILAIPERQDGVSNFTEVGVPDITHGQRDEVEAGQGGLVGPERQRSAGRERLDPQVARVAFEAHHIVGAVMDLTGRLFVDDGDVRVAGDLAGHAVPHALVDEVRDETLREIDEPLRLELLECREVSTRGVDGLNESTQEFVAEVVDNYLRIRVLQHARKYTGAIRQ